MGAVLRWHGCIPIADGVRCTSLLTDSSRVRRAPDPHNAKRRQRPHRSHVRGPATAGRSRSAWIVERWIRPRPRLIRSRADLTKKRSRPVCLPSFSRRSEYFPGTTTNECVYGRVKPLSQALLSRSSDFRIPTCHSHDNLLAQPCKLENIASCSSARCLRLHVVSSVWD